MNFEGAEAVHVASKAMVQLVIDLHYLAGRVQDEVVAAHIRHTADSLSDLERELHGLVS